MWIFKHYHIHQYLNFNYRENFDCTLNNVHTYNTRNESIDQPSDVSTVA